MPANFTVTSLLDDGSAGTLRSQIEAANTAAGPDTITFDGSLDPAGTIQLASGQLQIADDLTITGPGAAGTAPTLSIDALGLSRVISIAGPAGATTQVSLSGLIITGGTIATGDGAGIQAGDEALTLDRSVVTNNTITGTSTGNGGGGIAFGSAAGSVAQGGGSLTITNSTISGNSSSGRGGGIYFFDSGSLVMLNSTVSGNTARNTANGGGGIYFYGSVGAAGFTISNSTIQGNSTVNGNGGGILLFNMDGTLNLLNSTVSGNTSGSTDAVAGYGTGGGGISNLVQYAGSTAVLNIRSSIVSGNTADAANGNLDIAVYSTTAVNVDHSAIGSSSGFTYSDPTGTNLPLGAVLNLGALQANGGPTFTMDVPAGSPLIDAGSNPSNPPLTTDQRGHIRTQGAGTDIGAFERDSTTIPPTPSAAGVADVTSAAAPATYSFQVTYISPVSTINTSTLDDNDLAISGPGGFTTNAVRGTVDSTNPGAVVVDYSFTAPSGAWDPADNGTYSISVVAGQVTDAAGVAVPAGQIATFQTLIATTFHVTTTADAGAGSLREAITQANLFNTADTIVFDGPTFGTTQATITLASELPAISQPLTITGSGASLLTVRRDSANPAFFRIFTIGATSTLTGMTITGGATQGTTLGTRGGGGIALTSIQPATIENCAITGNSAAGEGGGIYVPTQGNLTVRNSTISGNTAGTDPAFVFGSGGGIYFRSSGVLNLEGCTISGNSSPTTGGGIYFFHGGFAGTQWNITNSTITGNSAASGGGIHVYTGDDTSPNPLTILNSTIVSNSASTDGGGLSIATGVGVNQGAITATNSVFAFNTSPTGPDAAAAITTSHSLIHDATGATITDDGTSLAAGTDPLFVGGSTPTLADNNGPTLTIALQPTSPLIDAGTATVTGVQFDQRGSPFVRVSGPAADIGAFEVQSAVAPTVASVSVNGGATQRSRVTTLDVTFSTTVTFATTAAAAFTLTRSGGGTVTFTATATVNGLGQTVVTLNAFTGASTDFGSLADGRYTLTVLANQVSAGGQNMASDFTYGDPQSLFRFYGDMNADRRVDISDFGFFSLAYLTPANYNPALDFNQDTRVDIADFGQFSVRYFTTLP